MTLFNLVKTAMRMRPDIMVVGEVRGEEAYALFQAISTGHGGLATLHAEDAASAIQRLTSKPMDVAPAYISFLDLIFSVRRVAIPNPEDPGSPRLVRRVISVEEVESVNKYIQSFSWEPGKRHRAAEAAATPVRSDDRADAQRHGRWPYAPEDSAGAGCHPGGRSCQDSAGEKSVRASL